MSLLVKKYFDTIDSTTKSIFLAGPAYRIAKERKEKCWRIEALKILETLNFDGIVYIPDLHENQDVVYGTPMMEWEQQALEASTIILFWIPRSQELLGLTTNIEFGLYLNTNKLVVGFPVEAMSMDYIKFCCDKKQIQVSHSLYDTCFEALTSKLLI